MHGWQHTAVNTAVLVPLCGLAVALHREGPLVPFAAAYLLGTLLVTPDLDLHFNDARRRWGGLRFIWAPYAALSKHRGMSHSWLLGPLIRLGYLALWCGPPVWLMLRVTAWSPVWPPAWVLGGALFGYLLSQWLHLLCDGLLPFTRRSVR